MKIFHFKSSKRSDQRSYKKTRLALASLLLITASVFAFTGPLTVSYQGTAVKAQESTLVAQADLEPPSDVENLKATPGDGQVVLSWDVATDNDFVQGYNLYYGTDSVTNAGGNYGFGPVDVGNKIVHTVTGLTNGTPYYFAMTAYDTSGNESANYSVEVSATPVLGAADSEAPTVISAKARNKNSVEVVFSEAVILPVSEPATAFLIKNDDTQVALEVIDAEMDDEDEAGATVLLTTTDQTADASYIVTAGIDIEDIEGNNIVSGTSDTALFVGTDLEHGAAEELSAGDSMLSLTAEGPALEDVMATDGTHVMVLFSEPVILAADPLDSFYITEVANNDNSLDITNVSVDADGRTVMITTAPQENIDYNLIVLDARDVDDNQIDIANNATTFSGLTGALIADAGSTQETTAVDSNDTTAPEDASNLVAAMIKKMIATLSWNASLNSAGDLASYVLYQSTDGVAFGPGTIVASDATTFDVAGLAPDTEYFFKLTAKDEAGNESEGITTSFMLPETGPEMLLLLGASMGAGRLLKSKKKKALRK